ncbi:MAG: mechanosensitive ion channel family protein, partial [Puniceicoccales bacterium]|nr:mechanosensitive ion channel family protein [Puniceicoccales bacterium]
MINFACDCAQRSYCQKKSDQRSIIPFLQRTCHVIIGISGALLSLNCLGISVGGLFATLGIGGALIAFAAKDLFANIFGSLALILDRPFRIGDWIILRDGNIDGRVECIG